MEAMYKNVCQNAPFVARMSPSSAEICKLAVNCFVTTKISFANMVGDIADATPGANKNDILAAVGSDSRVGLKCLRPGYGFGGPCFPRYNLP
jgi:UDP-glucose 6-dehydrogenase